VNDAQTSQRRPAPEAEATQCRHGAELQSLCPNSCRLPEAGRSSLSCDGLPWPSVLTLPAVFRQRIPGLFLVELTHAPGPLGSLSLCELDSPGFGLIRPRTVVELRAMRLAPGGWPFSAAGQAPP